jgi:hypothetical protein
MKTALQPGLSLEKFAFMQEVMRGTFGISELQYRNASPMQAERCFAVPWAKPTEDEASRLVRTAAPKAALRILVMTVSVGFRRLRSTAVAQVAAIGAAAPREGL